MERDELISFIRQYGSRDDQVNLLEQEEFQLRTIAQRLISEQRTDLQNGINDLLFNEE